MYAVFATGGKQYRAVTGDILKIEKLDAEKGTTVELDQVLMVGEGADVKVGSPYLKGGTVTATVVDHGRGKKIRILPNQQTGCRALIKYLAPSKIGP